MIEPRISRIARIEVPARVYALVACLDEIVAVVVG
jgi:hypothetical protein